MDGVGIVVGSLVCTHQVFNLDISIAFFPFLASLLSVIIEEFLDLREQLVLVYVLTIVVNGLLDLELPGLREVVVLLRAEYSLQDGAAWSFLAVKQLDVVAEEAGVILAFFVFTVWL